jgi:hypothetical protein
MKKLICAIVCVIIDAGLLLYYIYNTFTGGVRLFPLIEVIMLLLCCIAGLMFAVVFSRLCWHFHFVHCMVILELILFLSAIMGILSLLFIKVDKLAPDISGALGVGIFVLRSFKHNKKEPTSQP